MALKQPVIEFAESERLGGGSAATACNCHCGADFKEVPRGFWESSLS